MSSVSGMNTEFGREISRFTQAPKSSANLGAYLSGYSISSRSFSKYSDIPIIEEFIHGTDRAIQAMKQFKANAGIMGPLATLGGSDLDQAERALLAVYVFAFEEADLLGYLLDNPETNDAAMNKLVKQVSNIRVWA